MAKKTKSQPDKVEKILEDYGDVFSDIINIIVYDGKEVVLPENLVDSPTASRYKAANGVYGEKDRDILKIDQKNNVEYIVYGLENQAKVNNIMPVRVMGYDFASYDENIKKIKAQNKVDKHEPDYAVEVWPGQKLRPVVTIVLYFGLKEWNGPFDLYDMVDIPAELKGFVSNYHINLVQVAFLPEETIAKFKSDFQIVAELFRCKRLGIEKKMCYTKKKWIHVEELLEFFKTFTHDDRYQRVCDSLIRESEKGEVNMCTFIDEIKIEGKIETIKSLMQNGFSEEKAMELAGLTAEEKQKCRELLSEI